MLDFVVTNVKKRLHGFSRDALIIGEDNWISNSNALSSDGEDYENW